MACHVVKISQALRKSPSSEKVVYEYFDTYDIFLLCMPMKDISTQNCIQTSWNALILPLSKYKTKDKSFPFN